MLYLSITLPAFDKSMLFVSRVALLKQHQLWTKHLPMVKPFYAVKSNNDPTLLRWIQKLGLRVDCASPGEMRECLKAGFHKTDILYANTMKSATDLKEAMDLRIGVTTTDSVEGVEQLAKHANSMKVIVRLAVRDLGSRCPFSIKFGSREQEWYPIMKAIREHNLVFGGVSFHVGSGASDPEMFRDAIRTCRHFQNHMNCDIPLVDIGGGFLPNETSFKSAAEAITGEMDEWSYRSTPPKEWIAEPGRFFSSPVQTLLCPIVFKKKTEDMIRYTLDDSLYGQFSNIVYDHAKPGFTVNSGDRILSRTTKMGLFFGKTCDSLDLIMTQDGGVEYQVGDFMVFPYMGAYTSSSATTFNGFAFPKKVYLDCENMDLPQHGMFKEVEPMAHVDYPIETKSKVNLSLQ